MLTAIASHLLLQPRSHFIFLLQYASISVIERQSPYNDFGIYLYPNPSTGFIMLDSLNLSENWVTVSVSNSTGVKVSALIDIRNKTKVSIDVRSLRTGIYFATLTSKDGRHTSLKFIKQ
jgi:hypothetical protein